MNNKISETESFKYIYDAPQNDLFEVAKKIKTPGLIYDFNQINNVANAIKNDLSMLEEAKLNFAVKACHNLEVLKAYAEIGLGCDVASIFEYNLAKKAGFKNITTTAPAYKISDMKLFHNEGIIIDLDSIDQIELFGQEFPSEQIGLRVKIPTPQHFVHGESFKDYVRFGVDILNEKVDNAIKKYGLIVKRLHVHTGQMTPEDFIYKIKYLLTIAEYFNEVDTIDVGGGLLYFYVDRKKVISCFKLVSGEIKKWKSKNNRNMEVIFEPGGALITLCGYLVTQVMAVNYNFELQKRVVTVDSSAWNIAPWQKPVVLIISPDKQITGMEKTLIAGNTLYERDFFGNTNNGKYTDFDLGNLKFGDRLILSASGGYTITNARRFNGLPLPQEYKLFNGMVEEI